ncbi:MAG TPA: right-handed parallel beta-helix repeat-containing protein [Sandaracinaceae bacterium LLY-WYZ-13_1]|nr:right-handed parallel beta-helix repeat-containing protein [Sandaracinaceae bacterium LLY-WYZ-13_1]
MADTGDRRRALTAIAALALSTACGADPCDADAVRAALAAAAPGDVVEVGACRLTGSFVVPAGVTLEGRGEASVLEGGGLAGSPVQLEGGTEPARLSSVRVETRGPAGVSIRGGGSAVLEDVAVFATRGIGLGIDGVATTLTRVRVEGPVTEANAGDARWIRVAGAPLPGSPGCPRASCECEPGDVDVDGETERVCNADGRWATWTATYGIYATGAELSLTDVEVAGLAAAGVVVADGSSLDWRGGGIRDVIGVGLLVLGGDAAVEDATIERVVEGLRGVPSYGVIATEGANLDTRRVRLSNGARYGLLQLDATGTHDALTVEGHGDAGVWVGDSDAFTLRGASVLADNGFAGIVVADSQHVSVEGARISGTRRVRRSVGMAGDLEVGDGVHLSGSHDDVRLTDVVLEGNERVGLLADLGAGAAADVTFDRVEVRASGGAFGALAGERDVASGAITVGAPAGWDTGITRAGAAVTNDPVASGAFDAVVIPGPVTGDVRSIVAPMF